MVATSAVRWLLVCQLVSLAAKTSSQSSEQQEKPTQTIVSYNLSNNNSWLHLRFANQTGNLSNQVRARGQAIEVTPPSSSPPFHYQSAALEKPLDQVSQFQRNTRTAAYVNYDDQTTDQTDEPQLLVSNTCERDFMLIEIRTNKPFYGLIHTLNHRRKLVCTSEGDGGTHFKLSISHTLNPSDPQYCGVTRLANNRASEEKQQTNGELLSVILAVRSHRNIELSEDKFFALNCTNRCRRPDCSSGQQQQLAIGKLVNNLNWHQLERDESDLLQGDRTQQLLHSRARPLESVKTNSSECSIWQSSWIVALALCLAIILFGMLLSNCIICLALRQKRQVESTQIQQTLEQAKKLSSTRSDQMEIERRRSRRRNKYIDYDNNNFNYQVRAPAFEGPDYIALQHQQQQQREQQKRSHNKTATMANRVGQQQR